MLRCIAFFHSFYHIFHICEILLLEIAMDNSFKENKKKKNKSHDILSLALFFCIFEKFASVFILPIYRIEHTTLSTLSFPFRLIASSIPFHVFLIHVRKFHCCHIICSSFFETKNKTKEWHKMRNLSTSHRRWQ